MWSRALWISIAQRAHVATRPAIFQQERKIARWVAPTIRKINRRKMKVRQKPAPRNQWLDWNNEAELYAFSKRLHENFDKDLLQRAFTHRSYIINEEMRQRKVGIENPDIQIKDNEDLIQEGESFISEYVQAYLSVALPKFPEPGICALRDYLTTTQMLAHISLHLGTKDIIRAQGYPPEEETYANTFKAIVAALAHSSGGERAGTFVRDFVITQLNGVDINDVWKIDDPMTMFKNLLKKSGKEEPEPRLIGQIGKNTVLACFRVGLYIDKEMFCYGFGESPSIATEMAAREGLKILFETRDNMPPINFKMKSILKDLSEEERKLLSQ